MAFYWNYTQHNWLTKSTNIVTPVFFNYIWKLKQLYYIVWTVSGIYTVRNIGGQLRFTVNFWEYLRLFMEVTLTIFANFFTSFYLFYVAYFSYPSVLMFYFITIQHNIDILYVNIYSLFLQVFIFMCMLWSDICMALFYV